MSTAIRLGLANIVEDVREAYKRGVLRDHVADIPVFRIAQFYGTYRGFAQKGPVPDLLRRRFYYPPEQSDRPDSERPAGRLIDYDEPVHTA